MFDPTHSGVVYVIRRNRPYTHKKNSSISVCPLRNAQWHVSILIVILWMKVWQFCHKTVILSFINSTCGLCLCQSLNRLIIAIRPRAGVGKVQPAGLIRPAKAFQLLNEMNYGENGNFFSLWWKTPNWNVITVLNMLGKVNCRGSYARTKSTQAKFGCPTSSFHQTNFRDNIVIFIRLNLYCPWCQKGSPPLARELDLTLLRRLDDNDINSVGTAVMSNGLAWSNKYEAEATN